MDQLHATSTQNEDTPSLMPKTQQIPENILAGLNEFCKNLNIDKMPECSEKYLHYLDSFFSQKTWNKYQIEEVEAPFLRLLELFLHSLESEGWPLEEFKDEIESMKNKINGGVYYCWCNREHNLHRISSKMLPFDISAFLNHLQKSLEAGKDIAGKDMILLLGNTGSGRSALTHFLAGSKMGLLPAFRPDGSEMGFLHVGTVGEVDEKLKDVKISPWTHSETRVMKAVELDLTEILPCSKYDKITICDTPALPGCLNNEINLANCLGLIKAVRSANKVFPVYLISHKLMGENWFVLEEISEVLKQIFSDTEYVLNVHFMFTHISKDGLEGIVDRMTDVQENLEAAKKDDSWYCAVLDEMIWKISRLGPIGIDPIEGDRVDILETILSNRKRRPISKPEEAFREFFPPEAVVAIKKQVQVEREQIIKLCNNFDFPLLKFKLERLKKLFDATNLEFIGDSYQDCVQTCIKIIDSKCKDDQTNLENGHPEEADVGAFRTFIEKFNCKD